MTVAHWIIKTLSGLCLLLASSSVFALGAGQLDTGFTASTDGQVEVIVVQDDGKILIGGQFWTVNGMSRNNIARLNSDGTLDTGFNPSGTDDTVLDIAVQSDGKIIIAGWFTVANGISRPGVARLQSSGSLDSSFNPTMTGNLTPSVHALAIQSDGRIIIGGSFNSVSGTVRYNIARLLTNGSLDTAFNTGLGTGSTTDWVESVELQSDGKVVIGGSFTTYDGSNSQGIARLNSNGTRDSGYVSGTGFNDEVYVVDQLSDGRMLVGGEFTLYGTSGVSKIARLNTNGSLSSFGLSVTSGSYAFAEQADGKIIAGLIAEGGGITRVSSSGVTDPTFNPGAGVGGGIYALAIGSRGGILVGGAMPSYNGTQVYNIARISSGDTDDDGIDDIVDTDDDNDGMPDVWENSYSLNPLVDDSAGDADSDGLNNGDEYLQGTLPNDSDTDNDGINDGADAFPLNINEWADNDQDGTGDNADTDDDNDGMPDTWEETYSLNPLVDDASDDADNDGITNLQEYLDGTDPTVPEHTSAKNDTDGDLDSDIIWRNRTNGTLTVWEMQNKLSVSATDIPSFVDYELIDSNDLDADGDSDLVLFKASEGRALKWEMENNSKVSGALLAGFPGYVIRGLGDVDADGDADIVWQAESWGGVILWIMEGGVKQSGNFIGSLGNGSAVVAVGDFDNDGDADLLWSLPASDALVRWDMENAAKVNGASIGGFAGYSVVEIGDYNNDGTDDLLWEPDGGGSSSIIWLMANGDKDTGVGVGTLPGYSIATTGDYDADGDDDILWKNAAGGTIIWELENGAKVAGNSVAVKDANSDVRP